MSREALLLACILVAGCVAPQATLSPAAPAADGPPTVPTFPAAEAGTASSPPTWADLKSYGTPDDGTGTASDGYLLEGSISPQGALTGYTWKMPEGAVVHSDKLRQDLAYLEIVPMVDGSVDLDGFVAGMFAVEGGRAKAVHVMAQFPGSVNYTDRGQAVSFDSRPGLSASMLASPPTRDIRFVLGGTGPARNVTWLMVIHDSTPFDGDAGVIRTPADAAARLAGHRLHRLGVAGTGTGLFGGSYARIEWPWADLSMWQQSGQVRYNLTTGPAGAVREYSVSVPVQQGWSAGSGYEGSDADAGFWTLQGAAHGLPLQDASLLAHSKDATADALLSLAGYSLYTFVAEGRGPVQATFTVNAAGEPEEYFRSFQELTLGTPLSNLVGVPGESRYQGYGSASRWLQVLPDPLDVPGLDALRAAAA